MDIILWIIGILVAIAVSLYFYKRQKGETGKQHEELIGAVKPPRPTFQFLCWEGLDDHSILDEFKEAHVQPRRYHRDDVLEILKHIPIGEIHWDVVLADIEAMEVLCRHSDPAKRLLPLSVRLTSQFDRFLEPIRNATVRDGQQLFAVPLRFGVNALAYNTQCVVPELLYSYDRLFSDSAFRGKIGVWDWWLPNMGVISKYLAHGNSGDARIEYPFRLNDQQIDEVFEKLELLTEQQPIRYKNLNLIKDDLAKGNIWVVLTGGEWCVPRVGEVIKSSNVDWLIPEEGGLLWIECLGVFQGSDQKDLSQHFIEFLLTNGVQEKIRTSGAYRSDVVVREVMDKLDDAEMRIHKIFHTDNISHREASKLLIRRERPEQPEVWQQKWDKATRTWRLKS